jgi:hypothetical protein
LTLRPACIVAALALIALLLAVGGYAGQVAKYRFGFTRSFGLIPLLDLDREANISSWFASGLLLLGAILLGVIGTVVWQIARREARPWFGLMLIFIVLSIDEAASIHEMSMDLLKGRFSGGWFFYPWVVLGAAFALGVFAVYVPFLLRLPSRTRFLFLLSGGIYLSGALVLEMIGADYASTHSINNLGFVTLAHIEECLEMAGAILFIYSLLDYLQANASPLTIQLDHSVGAEPPTPPPPLRRVDPFTPMSERVPQPAHAESVSS